MNIKKLVKILKNHEKWLESNGTKGQRADLRGIDLSDLDLRGIDLRDAKLPHYIITPEEGEFIGWKRLRAGRIAKLLIPAHAKRITPIGSRKCRASEVKVLEIRNDKNRKVKKGFSICLFLPACYVVGEVVKADSFDDDIRKVCTHGIHFFITRNEAVDWYPY